MGGSHHIVLRGPWRRCPHRMWPHCVCPGARCLRTQSTQHHDSGSSAHPPSYQFPEPERTCTASPLPSPGLLSSSHAAPGLSWPGLDSLLPPPPALCLLVWATPLGHKEVPQRLQLRPGTLPGEGEQLGSGTPAEKWEHKEQVQAGRWLFQGCLVGGPASCSPTLRPLEESSHSHPLPWVAPVQPQHMLLSPSPAVGLPWLPPSMAVGLPWLPPSTGMCASPDGGANTNAGLHSSPNLGPRSDATLRCGY